MAQAYLAIFFPLTPAIFGKERAGGISQRPGVDGRDKAGHNGA